MTATLGKEKKGYYLPPELLERLRLVAAKRDVARSRIVEEALEAFLRDHESGGPGMAQSESLRL